MALQWRWWRVNPKSLALAALILCAFGAPAIAQPAPDAPKGDADNTRGSFIIQVENDVFNRFAPSDRDYTSGIRFGWMSGPTDIPGWLVAVTAFPAFFGEPASTRIDRRWGLSIGQNIYTPEDILSSQRVVGDRPYAGWLYLAGILQYTHYKKDERDREVQTRQDTLMLDVGVVGPAAGGEFVQNNVHNIIRVDRANGWANQLHNEPTIGLTFERRWRTGATTIFDEPRLELDFVPRAAVALGNVATYASVGGQLRFGRDLSIDFGAARPRPALPGSDAYAGAGFAWYLFAGGDAQVWARNMFVDGNLDGTGSTVTRRPFVGEAQVGLALIFEGVRITFSHVLRTPEFFERDRITQFGSVNVTFRY
jgi:lipid A 3-O-deacylase